MEQLVPDELYLERGTVSWSRPIFQGDVFKNIPLPGFPDASYLIQVLTHPCSMRRGTNLNEWIQVAPVKPYQNVTDWHQHGKWMPLPDLLEDGSHYATKFVDLTGVQASKLTLGSRIASLSERGVLALQQRLVRHSTRLELEIEQFRQQSAPVLVEADLQEAWVETVLGNELPTEELIDRAIVSFHHWLDEDDKRRRNDLQSEVNHSRLRKDVRAAAAASQV